MPSRLRLKLSTSFFSHTYNQHVKKIIRNFGREKKNPSFSQCLAIFKKKKFSKFFLIFVKYQIYQVFPGL